MLSSNKSSQGVIYSSPIMQLYTLIAEEYRESMDYQMGKVLTIVDASISDPEQRKGIKDLIRNARYEGKDWHIERIRLIIKEFNESFSQLKINDSDAAFLKDGNWDSMIGDSTAGSLPQSTFFVR